MPGRHILQRLQPILVDLTVFPSRTDIQWPGVLFFRERFFAFCMGFAAALLLWVVNWVLTTWLPRWLIAIGIIFDCWSFMRRFIAVLRRHESSSLGHLVNLVFWIGLLFACFLACSPNSWLLAYVGLTQFLVSTVCFGFVYLQSDEPAGPKLVHFLYQADMSLGYAGCFWLIFDSRSLLFFPRWLARTATSTWLARSARATLPHVAGISLVMLVRGILSIQGVLSSGLLIFGAISRAITYVLNLCEVLEAYLLVDLPRGRQRRLCHEEQRERARHQTATHRHSSLKLDEIRLLVLEQPSVLPPGTIRAEVLVTRLDSAPPFEAVSYRWQSSERTEEILINEQRFKIPKSAFEALLARRSFWRGRTVWIDAICINQDDNQEKSIQVGMMHSIYSKAERVILMPTHDWKARIAASAIYEAASGLGLSGHNLDLHQLGWKDPGYDLSLATFNPRCRAYAALFTKDYFGRAWIVQEVVAGKDVHLYLGGIYVSWDILRGAVSRLSSVGTLGMIRTAGRLENPDVDDDDDWHSQRVETIHTLRSDSLSEWFRLPEELQKLGPVLALMANFKATDPRDKVFAVAGLTNQHYRQRMIQPDYSLETKDVYRRTARKLFLKLKTPAIDLLFLAGRGWQEQSASMPSWVPDFTGLNMRYPYTNMSTNNPRFRAGGTLPPSIREINANGIAIKSILCGSIAEISEATMLDNSLISGQNMATLENFLRVPTFVQAAIALSKKHQDHLAPNSSIVHALHADILEACSEEGFSAFLAASKSWNRLLNPNTIDVDKERKSQELNKFMEYFFREADGKNSIGQFLTRLNLACAERRFGITSEGRYCLVPGFARVGDLAWIPLGAQTPYVVRKTSAGFELVGEAYVQGMMLGEALLDKRRVIEEIHLV